MLRSEDSGFSWTKLGQGLPVTDIGALAFDSLDPTTIHAGTRSGYFVSADRGTNFIREGAGLKSRAVYGLVVHPLDPAWLYAATDGGVFQSTNRGLNWRAINVGLGNRRVETQQLIGRHDEPGQHEAPRPHHEKWSEAHRDRQHGPDLSGDPGLDEVGHG